MRISDWSSDVCSSDLVEEAGVNLILAQRRERQRRHELLARAGQDAAHGHARLAQQPHKLDRLIGRDAAADDEQDAFRGHGSKIPQSACRARRRSHNARYPAWRSEEHTSELQSLMRRSYAVFCWTQKTRNTPCPDQST